jgi:hypothetical protein
LRERLSLAGQGAVRERTWERALQRLAAGYDRVLTEHAAVASAATLGESAATTATGDRVAA